MLGLFLLKTGIATWARLFALPFEFGRWVARSVSVYLPSKSSVPAEIGSSEREEAGFR